jgi:hypothetical protein
MRVAGNKRPSIFRMRAGRSGMVLYAICCSNRTRRRGKGPAGEGGISAVIAIIWQLGSGTQMPLDSDSFSRYF